jgi:hypothetical protein
VLEAAWTVISDKKLSFLFWDIVGWKLTDFLEEHITFFYPEDGGDIFLQNVT